MHLYLSDLYVRITSYLLTRVKGKAIRMAAGNILYRVAIADDFDAIEVFLIKHYVPKEPTSQALCIKANEEMINLLRVWIKRCLLNPVSFIAVNKQNEIVGTSLNYLCDLDLMRKTTRTSRKEATPCISNNLTPVAVSEIYLNCLEAGYQHLIPKDCHKIIKFDVLCVNTDEYGRQGIAMKLVEISMENAPVFGCTGAASKAVAKATQGLFRKADFEVVKVMLLEDFVDENGKQMINCRDGTIKGEVVFKRIGKAIEQGVSEKIASQL